jgi:4,4'-diaponeurosporenoate glycosyltransferase
MTNDILTAVFLLVGFWLMFRIPSFSKRSSRSSDERRTDVSVIIPARNEEKRIGPLLRSLASQTVKGFETIVVDDESSDNTAALSRELGATVIASKPLPKGWRGKSWASHQGAEAAKGDILVFLDADTVLETDGLARILEVFDTDRTPMSVQPDHVMKPPYERLSVFFNIIVMMSSNRFTPLQGKLRSRVFFGPCQVMTRKDYVAIGGHESVKSDVLEDIHIGNRLLESGTSVRLMAGRGAVSFRMYPDGVKDIVMGWGKNFASGAMSIGIANVILVSLWLSFMYAAFVGVLSGFPAPDAINWILYALYGIQVWWIARRIGNFGPSLIILYPIHAVFFLFVFLVSLYRTFFKKKVSWKGRDIDMKEGE